jgi:CheY-like chemotaxis protein
MDVVGLSGWKDPAHVHLGPPNTSCSRVSTSRVFTTSVRARDVVSVLALMAGAPGVPTVGEVGGVFIVDDNAPFRSVARAVLESGGFQVVGEAATGNGALSAVPGTTAAVVLLDIGLPDIDGFQVCAALRRAAPGTVVVLCSVRDAEHYGAAVERSGAAGFLQKSGLSAAAITRIVAGQDARR